MAPWQIGCFGFLLIIGLAVVFVAFATLVPVVPGRLLELVANGAIWAAAAVGVVVFLWARGRE